MNNFFLILLHILTRLSVECHAPKRSVCVCVCVYGEEVDKCTFACCHLCQYQVCYGGSIVVPVVVYEYKPGKICGQKLI